MAAAAMLVVLRLSLGCHFLYEGVWKIKNPDFSAKSFLLQAKGPAAPLFHAMIPDIDGRQRLKIEDLVSTKALVARWRKVRDDCQSRLTREYEERLVGYERKRAEQEGKLDPQDEETLKSLRDKISRLTRAFEPGATMILSDYEEKLDALIAKHEPAMLACFDGDRWAPSAEQIQQWLSSLDELQGQYFAALREHAVKNEEVLKAVDRTVNAAGALLDEAAPLEKRVAGRQLRDPKDKEILRIAPGIRAEKFYGPWDELRQKVVRKYGLDQQQQAEAEEIYRSYKRAIRSVLADNQADIQTYFEALDRFEHAVASGNRGAAHQEQRDYDQRQKLRAEADVWLAGLEASDKGFQDALSGLLTPEQARLGPLPVPWTRMDLIDFAVTYGLTAIGLCLLLGLFTRPAALGGGLFMLFVVLTQPAWPTLYPPDPPIVGHALLINKDFVEMVALFTLAATAAGRWGGLDFFVENFVLRLWRSRKNQKDTRQGKRDESDS